MKTGMKKKLQSNAGESLAEVIVAVLVVALGMLLLASAVVSGANVIKTSEAAMNDYYENMNELELQEGDVQTVNAKVQLNRQTGTTYARIGTIAANKFGSSNIDLYTTDITNARLKVYSYESQALNEYIEKHADD